MVFVLRLQGALYDSSIVLTAYAFRHGHFIFYLWHPVGFDGLGLKYMATDFVRASHSQASHSPLFSILVTTFNREKLLPRCLDSISKQKFSDYEAILLDDGSTDGSLAILKEFAKNNPHASVYSQENKGSGPAFMAALSKAKGAYVVCLDSDDYLSVDALERLAAFITQENPDIVQFEFALDKADGTFQSQCKIGDSFVTEDKCDPHLFKMKHHLLSTWRSKALKTDLIHDLQVYGTGRGGDNIFIAQAIHLAKRIAYLSGCIYYCDTSNDSDSRKSPPPGFATYCLERWMKVLPWFLVQKRQSFMIELGNIFGIFTSACVETICQKKDWQHIKKTASNLASNFMCLIDKTDTSRFKAWWWFHCPKIMARLYLIRHHAK